MKSHAIACFQNSCKLAVIINQIIVKLYSRRSMPLTDSVLRNIRDQLDGWRANSPPYLKYDTKSLPEICCPPHILAQKYVHFLLSTFTWINTDSLLYHTTVILLHRPFYSSPIHHTACQDAAKSIEELLIFLENTFGFTRITYLMAYCVYTAASAIVKDVRSGDNIARNRMNTFLRALKGSCTTCPVVQRSIDIIMNSIKKQNLDNEPSSNECEVDCSSPVGLNPTPTYLPAFPRHEWQYDSTDPATFEMMDADVLSLLDCFPENHIDIGSTDWYVHA